MRIFLSLATVLAVAGMFVGAEAQGKRFRLRTSVKSIDFLGSTTIPTGTMFGGTEFGGISGLAYDARRGVYYALSDDRTDSRFYTLDIDLDRNGLKVVPQAVTTLVDSNNNPFPPNVLDPEGLVLTHRGTLFISSEGNARSSIAPSVASYGLRGNERSQLRLPAHYVPTATSGVRNNLAFESLTQSPFGFFLYTATENALVQDGPRATTSLSSPCSILQYEFGRPKREFRYDTDPIPVAPVPPTSFADNGLVEMLSIDATGGMLALERSFAVGVGNDIRLYEIRLRGIFRRGPVGRSGLVVNDKPVKKRLLLRLPASGRIPVDNVEAMAFGPRLRDGRTLLILASDNNFNPSQTNLFLAFAVRFEGDGRRR